MLLAEFALLAKHENTHDYINPKTRDMQIRLKAYLVVEFDRGDRVKRCYYDAQGHHSHSELHSLKRDSY